MTILITLDIDSLTALWVFFDLLLESRLDSLLDLLIPLGAHEADSYTLRSESPCTSYTMQICIGGLSQAVFVAAAWVLWRVWHVVVDSDVDTLDIYTTAKDIGADADTMDEVLEIGVAFDTESIISISRTPR